MGETCFLALNSCFICFRKVACLAYVDIFLQSSQVYRTKKGQSANCLDLKNVSFLTLRAAKSIQKCMGDSRWGQRPMLLSNGHPWSGEVLWWELLFYDTWSIRKGKWFRPPLKCCNFLRNRVVRQEMVGVCWVVVCTSEDRAAFVAVK